MIDAAFVLVSSTLVLLQTMSGSGSQLATHPLFSANSRSIVTSFAVWRSTDRMEPSCWFPGLRRA